MVSDIACARVPAAPSSGPGAPRVGSVSLPEFESLRGPRDFRRVLGTGTRRRVGGLVLVSAPGRPGPPRVGLVVPRSVGTAVVRNRVKRRLRHAVAGKGLEPGMDYVMIANREASEARFSDIEDWVSRALGEHA